MSTFLLSERGAARVSRLSRREEGEKDYDVEAIEEWCRPTQDPKVRGAATGRNDPLGSRAACCTEGVVDDRHRHAEKGSSKGPKSNTEGVPQVVIDKVVAALNVPSRGGLLVLDDEDRIAEGHSGLQKIRVDSLEEERHFFVHRKEKDRLEKGSEEGREGEDRPHGACCERVWSSSLCLVPRETLSVGVGGAPKRTLRRGKPTFAR
jgi:hypothetical protein